MAINQVQMQPSWSLVALMQHYGTESQCEQTLAASRAGLAVSFVRSAADVCTRPSSELAVGTSSANAVNIRPP